MRDQILSGLRAAKANGHIRASESSLEATAAYVLDALAATPSNPPIPTVVAATTPVAIIDPREIVAQLAASAARLAPHNEAMTTLTIDADDDLPATRHLLWKLTRLFGVHAMTSKESTPDERFLEDQRIMCAGRPSDIHALRIIFGALIDAGRPEAARLPHTERATFWATVGRLIVSTGRAEAQIATAKARKDEARMLSIATFGAPSIVDTPKAAKNGSTVYEAATKTLAVVAL